MPVNPIEVLQAGRCSRGSLAAVSAHLSVKATSLARAEAVEIDVVGFRLTPAGFLRLVRIEEFLQLG